MNFLLSLFNRNSTLLLFLLLVIISLTLLFSYNSYHTTNLYSTLFCWKSAVNEKTYELKNYFHLKEENQDLVQENKLLKEKYYNLLKTNKKYIQTINDTIKNFQSYQLIPAQIINATLYNKNNYLTLKTHQNNQVQEGMGIITDKGVIGQVAFTKKNYALALSILHPSTKIKTRIKGKKHAGLTIWKGEDARTLHLTRIPKYIEIKIGDTIETDSKSTVYPEGIPIGRIIQYELNTATNDWDIKLQLFEELTSLNNAQIVHNLERKIIDSLEAKQEILDVE